MWGWTLASVVAIYATLGLAGRLATQLPAGLTSSLFGLGFLVALVTVGLSGWLFGSGRSEAWVRAGVAAVYGMILVRMGTEGAERTHLFEYGLVALLIHEALAERRRGGRSVPYPPLTAVVVASLLGWLDELLQGVVPGRVYLRDVGFNAGAAAMAVAASRALAWARSRDRGRAAPR
ncbi:MAG: VanZ family protein [Gemmatimonadetes bacterium]|nr:VanZ family protein [Gemmatimonadota bacterium]